MFKIKFSDLTRTSLAFSVVVLMLFQITPVRADVFLYTDPDYDFTFSVPDTWKRQVSPTPLTRVRFVSPVPSDHAYCEVSAQRDARFEIYPKRLMGKVMEENFDFKFWEKEVAQRFINPSLRKVQTIAGLDKGDATMAQVTYDMVLEKDKEPISMYATMLVSVYGDTRYVMTCGSTYKSYYIWGGLFGSVFSSMTLDDRYHIVPTGYYRNFLADKKHAIPHPGLGDIVK